MSARDDHEASVGSHIASVNDDGYRPVDSTAVLDVIHGGWTFTLAQITLDGTTCDVCTAPIGPTMVEVDPGSPRVYLWTPCWLGAQGLICAECHDELA